MVVYKRRGFLITALNITDNVGKFRFVVLLPRRKRSPVEMKANWRYSEPV
jgi:hypothetical protein